MPFPTATITLTTSDGAGDFAGPFQVAGGALYVALIEAGGTSSVYKSTDNGVTWARKNQAGEFPGGVSQASVLVGTKIHVATMVAGPFVQVNTFDTASDTWITGTQTPRIDAVVGAGPTLTMIFRVSDSKLIIGGGGPQIRGSGALNASFFLFDPVARTSGAWVACGDLNNGTNDDCFLWNILLGSGNRIHFVFVTPNQTPRTLLHQPLNAAVLGALQTIDTSPNDAGFTNVACVSSTSDGITIAVAWSPTSLTQDIDYFSAPSADVPIWTPQILTSPTLIANNPALNIVKSGTKTYMIFVSGLNAKFALATDSGLGFGVFVSQGSLVISLISMSMAALTTFAWGLVIFGSAFFLVPLAPPPIVPDPPVILVGAQPVSLPDPGTHCQFGKPQRCKVLGLGRHYVMDQNSKMNIISRQTIRPIRGS